MFVVMGSTYEKASNTSGAISYVPVPSGFITAPGIPPRWCVDIWTGTVWLGSGLRDDMGDPWDSSKLARGCWKEYSGRVGTEEGGAAPAATGAGVGVPG